MKLVLYKVFGSKMNQLSKYINIFDKKVLMNFLETYYILYFYITFAYCICKTYPVIFLVLEILSLQNIFYSKPN